MEDDLSHTAVKGETLCSRCQSLDLSVDRFIFENRSGTTPQERESPQSPKPTPRNRMNSGNVLKDFAKLEELRASQSTCAFCEMLCLAVQRYGSGDVNDSTTCSLCWEIDRRQQEDPSNMNFAKSSRRIRLSWSEASDNVQDVYIVLVPPQRSAQPPAESKPEPAKRMGASAQKLDAVTEVQSLIETWLGTCLDKHPTSCNATHNNEEQFRSLMEETYFGVIDVIDMQLKTLPMKYGEPESYVALSYVWGQDTQGNSDYVSTRTTVMQYIQRDGLQQVWERLPHTIQDSILLVQRLGYRFLWIDAFCIVQDSGNSWKLNSEAMHLIYGNALFTICAADGSSCSAGLRAAWRTVRPDQDRDNPSKYSTTDTDTDPIRIQCTPGLWLMVTRPLEAVVNNSTWNTRAWTFQERILSRRCVIFAENRVYFQCRANSVSQDTYSKTQSSGASLDLMNSSIQPLQEIRQRPIWCYMKYVSMYTGRKLTKASDILAAFQGISWLLELYMRAPLLFNLPISHFDLALLWSPTQPITMRRPHKDAASATKVCTQDANGNCACKTSHASKEDRMLPTWSWSGWEGGKIEYHLDSIDGCLINIGEWLKRHTWIQWFVRNEKGHLRPLWETMQRSTEPRLPTVYGYDVQDDIRWQGYDCRNQTGEEVARESAPMETQAEPRDAPFQSRFEPRVAPRFEPKFEIRKPQYEQTEIQAPGKEKQVEKVGENLEAAENRLRTRLNKLHDRLRAETHRNNTWAPRSPPPEREYNYYDRTAAFNSWSDSGSDSQSYSLPLLSDEFVVFYKSLRRNSEKSMIDLNNIEDNAGYVVDNRGTARPQPRQRVPVQARLPYRDRYGRLITEGVPKADENRFESILPDNPFGIFCDISIGKNEADSRYMPTLQFYTWRTRLSVAIRGQVAATLPLTMSDDPSSADHSGEAENTSEPAALRECDILDENDDWCGSVVLDELWTPPHDGTGFPFIALSDAKAFTAKECPTWNYYIPKERHESEWDLYYVLLLQYNDERGLWERRGLGKAFKAAFRNKEWAEIKLG
ncbi:hypothetical protein PG996_012261 [Apiospora saccharicola]|uniref:Heterokaryon incompatibility domain-containing protein n=1 Tax=Apiospora saccharicola TaxID=335842 RepID=A0ABR1U234_9PEZI